MLIAVLLAFAAPPAEPAFAEASKLIDAHDVRMKAFWKKMEEAVTEPEKDVVEKSWPDPAPVCDRVLALINGKEADPQAAPVLFWIVENVYADPRKKGTTAHKAVDFVIAHHLRHPEAGRFSARYVFAYEDPRIEPAIRRIVTENASPTARARAMICLAKNLEYRAGWRESLDRAESASNYKKWHGGESYIEMMKFDAASARKQALEIYRKLTGDPLLAAQPLDRFKKRSTIGSVAKNRLFELEHLRPGDSAPQTAGKDLHGKPFDLASQRGKVVLLQFCGNWCGPCRAEYPILRSLNEKFRNRPFTIVGVNSDENRSIAEKVHQTEKMSWPVLWDEVTDGPLHQKWNINSFPSTYLLDVEGRIIGRVHLRVKDDLPKIEAAVAAAEKVLTARSNSTASRTGK